MQGSQKPPKSATARRDERAEPDDDESSPRIDVVNVDGPAGGGGSARGEGAGISSLKAQLARLHEQASAVERSLDGQRRDRAAALDQLEQATRRCIHLETKVAAFEAEVSSLRRLHEAALAEVQSTHAERDGLARAVEAAKAVTGEQKEENEGLRSALEESMRVAATLTDELADLRKRQFQEALKVTDQEVQLAALRTKLERATAETGEARAEATSATNDAATAGEEARKLGQDLATAREDNERDRATARDRIDGIERALDEARAGAARAEADLDASRANEATVTSQLEAANARAADAETRAADANARAADADVRATDAETRAADAETSRATVEQDVRRLRDDIAAAFARIDSSVAAPSGASTPEAAQLGPAPTSVRPSSIPPPTYASVPPQIHESLPGRPTKS